MLTRLAALDNNESPLRLPVMYTTTTLHRYKRWLPALMLLVVLAQLSTSAHAHLEVDSVVDCTLCCVQQNAVDELTIAPHSHAFPSAGPRWEHAELLVLTYPRTNSDYGIRAPPSCA